jgi:hypothetical protein
MGFQVLGVNVRARGLPNIAYGEWVKARTTSLWPSSGVPVTWPPPVNDVHR